MSQSKLIPTVVRGQGRKDPCLTCINEWFSSRQHISIKRDEAKGSSMLKDGNELLFVEAIEGANVPASTGEER